MERSIASGSADQEGEDVRIIDKPKGSAGNGINMIRDMRLQGKKQTYLAIQVRGPFTQFSED